MSSSVTSVVPVFSIAAVTTVVPPEALVKQAPAELSVDERDVIRMLWVGIWIGAREPNDPVSVCLILVPPLLM
jgi:hypothetical protein